MSAPQSQTPAGVQPIPVDVQLLRSVFPSKDDAKLQQWVKVLHDEEVETVQDAAELLKDSATSNATSASTTAAATCPWDALNLPLAVKTTLKEHFKKLLVENVAQKNPAPMPEDAPTTPPAGSPKTGIPPPSSPASSLHSPPVIKQLDCIVLDVSQSMKSRSTMDPLKTREDVSKLMFHTMVDSLLALEMDHSLCLVSFGRDIALVKPPTLEYEAFHDEMGRLDARQGATKLFDAIECAADILLDFAATHYATLIPNCPLRIFALTDGEDNCSQRQAWEVTAKLQQKSITLDSFPMGPPNMTLQAMSTATGGLCVQVNSEEQGMGLFQREALLHVEARDAKDRKPSAAVTSAATLQSLASQELLLKDVTSSAPNKALVQSKVMSQAAVELRLKQQQQQSDSTATGATHGAQVGGGASIKRILKEYKDLQENPESCVPIVSMKEDDVTQWKCLLQAPAGSLYNGAFYCCTFQFPGDYPFKPPKFRMVTPIYHPNINQSGGICLDILKDQWSPALTAAKVLLAVSSLLTDPNVDDPLDPWKAQLYKSEPQRYESEARAHTAKHATNDLEACLREYKLLA